MTTYTPDRALAVLASFIEADADYQRDERPDLSEALDVLGALVDGDPLAADPQDDDEDGPFCWCGHAASRHAPAGVAPFCSGCAFDSDDEDGADPRHEFEDAALIDARLRVQHETTQNFVVAMAQVAGSADPEDDEDRDPLDDGLAYVQAHGDWHGSTVDLALHQVADLREVIERMGPALAGVNAYADGPRRDLDSAQDVLMREVRRLAAYWAEPLLEAIEDQEVEQSLGEFVSRPLRIEQQATADLMAVMQVATAHVEDFMHSDEGLVVARCSCGWESVDYFEADEATLAREQWTAHVVEAVRR